MGPFTEAVKLHVNGFDGEELCVIEGIPGVGNLEINGRTVVQELTPADLDNLISALRVFKSRLFQEETASRPEGVEL